MVEARFSCWFCLRYECSLRCPECNLAPYCSDQCMLRDLHRHKQLECIHFCEKTMCALCRKVLFSPTVDCQQCYSVTYCSHDCCQAHSSIHSTQCVIYCQAILANASKRNKWSRLKLPSVPPYIGHTLALDYLQLRHNEGPEMRTLNLLIVFFADIRSIVKTVVDLPTDFDGRIKFYLHETRPHLIARNVLFFYLACANPWPQCMTQIWYSVQLTEKCFQYLNSAIGDLIASDGYEKLTKCSRGAIQMTKEQYDICCEIWSGWFQLTYNSNIVLRQRDRRLGSWALSPSVHERLNSMPENHRKSWWSWYEDGLVLPIQSIERRSVCRPNPIMFCWNPCGTKKIDTRRYPELFSSRISHQISEMFDKNDEMIYGVPSNDSVFASWDYVQIKSTGCNSDDLLEMYCQYINTIFYSFCKSISRGVVTFRLLDGLISEIPGKIDANVNKMDRVCVFDAEESTNTFDVLATLRLLLNSSNSHACAVTHHELWYNANNLDRCGNMAIREPAFLLSIRDVDSRPYVLERIDADNRKSDSICRFWSCSDDYIDAWPLVYRHLQAEIFEFVALLDEKSYGKTLNVEEFVRQLGFHLKFYFREHHSVAPFRFQANIRRVSMQKSNCVSLEWKPIPVLSAA